MLPLHCRAPRVLPEGYSPGPENSAEQRAGGWTQGHPATLPRRSVSEVRPLASGISLLTLVCAEQLRGSYLRTPAEVVSVSAINQGQRGAGAQEEQRHPSCAPTRGRRGRPSFRGVPRPRAWQLLRNSQIPQVSGENVYFDHINVLE